MFLFTNGNSNLFSCYLCLTVFGMCSESDKPLTDMLIIYSVQSKMDLFPCGPSLLISLQYPLTEMSPDTWKSENYTEERMRRLLCVLVKEKTVSRPSGCRGVQPGGIPSANHKFKVATLWLSKDNLDTPRRAMPSWLSDLNQGT